VANFYQNLTSVGLQTLTFTVPVAGTGPYFLMGKLTLPQGYDDSATGNSACVVTIAQNSTTIYTGLAGAEGFRVVFSGTLGDTLTVTTSSAAAVDLPLNAVKMTLQFGQGV
jgi:hypothetical protein